MSDSNSNEKKNIPEKNNNSRSSENRKNYRNGNGQKNHHQKRPYQKGNNRPVNAPDADKTEKNAVNPANVKKDNSNVAAKDSQNINKKNQQNHGNKEFQKGGNRQNNFARRKANSGHMRVDETVEDIDIDIGRIEKEIELEIKEIAAFKFGL